jgi:hypothetical protein
MLYYATPGFQQSPSGLDEIKIPAWPLPFNKLVPPVGKTPLEVVTEHEYGPVGKDESESCEGTIRHEQYLKSSSYAVFYRSSISSIISFRVLDITPLDVARVLAAPIDQTSRQSK